jgi:uncharacterized SAM-binding protein YcdF (DUF218 family)
MILFLIGLGLVIIKKLPRIGRWLVLIGFLLLYLLSICPVSDALIRPLESHFPPFRSTSPLNSADSIVVLTGGAVDLTWLGISPEPSKTSLSRLVYGITLYKQNRGVNIVISGGGGDPEKKNILEADALKDVAVALGVSAKDILIERGSINTLESVKALKKLVGEKKIILVTSAYHMQRSAATFRKMGMNVVPAPTDYISEQKKVSLYSLIPTSQHLLTSSIAFYEYIGFIWYRINGKV